MLDDKRSVTCCFTGHRRLDAADLAALDNRIEQVLRELIGDGYTRFCAGGALGFDTMAAQKVLQLQQQYPHICLVLILPCRDQHQYWSAHDRAIYLDLCSRADEVIYTAERYAAGSMHRRNRALVASASTCLCYMTQSNGGTYYTVQQAAKEGLRVINVAHIDT